uniref:IF rod domain-containing protein n=1 Tax=Eptatretus burgeri TaxID=7764 RepID=A0A8C4QQ15_EPTBU
MSCNTCNPCCPAPCPEPCMPCCIPCPKPCPTPICCNPCPPPSVCIPTLDLDPICPAPCIDIDRSGQFMRSNEKEGMKCGNDRFASFIDKTRFLEQQNKVLEAQWECLQNKTCTSKLDCMFEQFANRLKEQLECLVQDRPRLETEMNQTQSLANDYRSKYEEEIALRTQLENEFWALKQDVDCKYLEKVRLETRLAQLNDEVLFLRTLFEQELQEMHERIRDMSVSVELDVAPNLDLTSLIAEVRCNYEAIAARSRQEVECWYKSKVSLSDCFKIVEQMLPTDIFLDRSQLEATIQDAEARGQASVLQGRETIARLENELQSAKQEMAKHVRDYQELMNVKLALDVEIATYKKLLEGEECRRGGWGEGRDGVMMRDGGARRGDGKNDTTKCRYTLREVRGGNVGGGESLGGGKREGRGFWTCVWEGDLRGKGGEGFTTCVWWWGLWRKGFGGGDSSGLNEIQHAETDQRCPWG